MNTIPLTFDEKLPSCTILGGKEKSFSVKYPISVLLLGRNPGSYKEQSLDVLINSGFENIITFETTKDNFKLEKYVQKFPQVKFIVPSEKVSVGEMINLGMYECKSEYLFVLWNDLVIKNQIFNDFLVNKIMASQCACFCPVFTNSVLQNIPVQMKPHIEKGSFEVIPSQVIYDNTYTLFPYDFVGVFNKEKFISVGGFDSTIKSSYWQNLDFSIRTWLWGEKIISSPIFRFTYEMSETILDSTVDSSYFRFYLKNIAPVYRNKYAYIPLSYFFQFHRRSSLSFSNAMKEFKLARKWVAKNAYHFKMDINKLTAEWGSEFSK
jgi:GT2 family glycosyltransferase